MPKNGDLSSESEPSPSGLICVGVGVACRCWLPKSTGRIPLEGRLGLAYAMSLKCSASLEAFGDVNRSLHLTRV